MPTAKGASPLANLSSALRRCFAGSEPDNHTIVVAAVRALSARSDADPLLFFKGDYVSVQENAKILEGVA